MVPASPPPAFDADGLYGLDALLAAAGERLGEEISARTVRLYATQGLLDRPGRTGRHAVYGQRQLLQLLLIRSLARRGLSLSAIAPLCALPDAEIAQQLAEVEATDPELAEREAFRQPALDYLRSLRQPPSAPSDLDDAVTPVESSRSLLPLLGAPVGRRSESEGAAAAVSREASSRWHRFTLMPGVELHLRDGVVLPPAGPRRRQWLHRLSERLAALLDPEDG
ncbi:MerR family transcriptional regulator [Cyanobium sp. NIES-981]|uniref:MerR family transcriptional regulator n=1 Tax=Cyanobium sp. NIES-981 TaxID=1851505 RepID=UPI0012FA7421|nr:MerR family transcriptional regulator [Cyanobium sp. NIES-981]